MFKHILKRIYVLLIGIVMLLITILLFWNSIRSISWPIFEATILKEEVKSQIVNTRYQGTIAKKYYNVYIKYKIENEIYMDNIFINGELYIPGKKYLPIKINPDNPKEISYSESRWDIFIIICFISISLIIAGMIRIIKSFVISLLRRKA